MKQIENDLNLQVAHVGRMHRQRAEEAFSALGLHVGQEHLLFALWEHDGLTQSQLASSLCLDLSTVNKMVQHMELAGFLERHQDPQDARVSRVYLTGRGVALQEPLLRAWKALEERTVQGLNETEKALLRRLLLHISANLS